jgi:hypothetical protein
LLAALDVPHETIVEDYLLILILKPAQVKFNALVIACLPKGDKHCQKR